LRLQPRLPSARHRAQRQHTARSRQTGRRAASTPGTVLQTTSRLPPLKAGNAACAIRSHRSSVEGQSSTECRTMRRRCRHAQRIQVFVPSRAPRVHLRRPLVAASHVLNVATWKMRRYMLKVMNMMVYSTLQRPQPAARASSNVGVCVAGMAGEAAGR